VPELARAGAPVSAGLPSRALFLVLGALGLLSALALGGTDLIPPLAPVFLVLLVLQLLAVRSPQATFYVLIANAVFFPVLPITAKRGVNPIDALIGPALLGSWLWFRARPKRRDTHLPAEVERSRLVAAGLTYYGVALLSLAVLAARGRPLEAGDSLLLLSRSIEGALYFVLATRLIRRPEHVKGVGFALLAGFLFSAIANAACFVPRAEFDIPRAGAVLILGAKRWYVANPNEEAAACLLLYAVALAFPIGKALRALALFAISTLLVTSLSRSGLLAGVVFVAVLGLQKQWRWLWLMPLLVAASFPFLPSEWVLRVTRTLVLERGSFEAYSSLVRVFTWEASLRTFLAHPILGVGYLGYRFFSSNYNSLGAVLVTAESMYLETAAGMGIVGLAALVWIAVAGLRLAKAIRKESAPGTVAARLASITPAYVAGVAAGNITGDNLIGMMAVAQLALFFGLLAQSARVERDRATAAAGAPA
jgi:O-antigen ligase